LKILINFFFFAGIYSLEFIILAFLGKTKALFKFWQDKKKVLFVLL